MTTMIEIQQEFVTKLHIANAKRASGLAYARSKGAARKSAIKQLAKIGYPETQIEQIMKDAHDMFVLERDARDVAEDALDDFNYVGSRHHY